MTKIFKTTFSGSANYLPARAVTNHDLSKIMDTNDEWIRERSGIRERRFAEPHQTTSDLAVAATTAVLEKLKLEPKDFDFILAATLSSDFFFPGIGPMVQHRLNFPTIPALDIRVQCSAFVYGTQIIDSLIKSGMYKRVLLITADLQSKLLNMTNDGRNVAVLFGDGASAIVYEAQECNEAPTAQNKISGIIDSILGSDGSGVPSLYQPSPGTGKPQFITEEDIKNHQCHPLMEGKNVFKNAVYRMQEVATTLLERNNIKSSEISMVIPHQANFRISESLREKLNLPEEKVFNNIDKYGNTTSATIGICITEAMEQGRIKKGDLILTCAFGAGFTWGGNLIRI